MCCKITITTSWGFDDEIPTDENFMKLSFRSVPLHDMSKELEAGLQLIDWFSRFHSSTYDGDVFSLWRYRMCVRYHAHVDVISSFHL